MSGCLLHLLLCTKHLFLASIQIIQMKMGPRDVWCIMQPKLTCGLKVIRGNLFYNIFQCYLAAPMFVHNGLMTALMSYLTAPVFISAYMISSNTAVLARLSRLIDLRLGKTMDPAVQMVL